MSSTSQSSASAARRPDAVLAELEVLRRENAQLRADNTRLRERLHLPAPPPAQLAPVRIPAPRSPGGLAGELAAVLAEVLEVDTVAPDRHFITDLGADSLLMAKFCARARKRPGLPPVSIKDTYRHPTINALAEALAPTPESREGTRAPVSRPAPDPAPLTISLPRYHLCGLLQLLAFLGFVSVATSVMAQGFLWIAAGPGLLDVYVRSATYAGATFAGACLVPILAKWTLIGRWTPRQIPVWSLAYLRFWLVKTLIRTNPLVRFVGTPLYSLYLRALGAKIGRGAVILSAVVPVCTDLLTVGAGTVIRKDSSFSGYRAVRGVIQIGPVDLGRDVYVGEMTVLDIGTSMGDGAQLGHSSALHAGQSVPAGARWHGSPAEPTTVDHRAVRTTRLSVLRRVVLPLLQLLVLLGVTLPVATGALIVVFREVPQLASLLGDLPPVVTNWTFYRDATVLATALYFGSLLLGMIMVVTVPRLLRLLVRPDRDYRLYGIRYWAHRSISRMTNRGVFTRIYGDSSYIVYYLRSIGYDLSHVVQTGSNFGTAVKHDNPFLTTVGSATVVADGLSVINADYSSSHFRVSRVAIGAQNFLGNRVAYPTQGRTGDNCLLATKVMVPLDGPVREGAGLLGSPSFEIPRTVDRDLRLDVSDPVERRRKVLAKTRHNSVSILLLLASRWLLTCLLTVLTLGTVDLYSEFGPAVAALTGCLVLPLVTAYFVLLDRIMRGQLAHRPDGCSIYDRAFLRHERYWKVCADTYLQLFNGTPFKNVLWRLLGVKIGRRVFDDGCFLTERVFVTIGDRSTLNAGSVIQCHSQEDAAFKSDHSALGRRCTLGVGAFVHYGVQIDATVLIEADSLVMKGSAVPAGTRWGGNPAHDLGDPISGEPQFRRRRYTPPHRTRTSRAEADSCPAARSGPGAEGPSPAL